MNLREAATVRLEPMSREDYQESLKRAIRRHATDSVARGVWTQQDSLEASEKEFAEFAPQGVATPSKHFAHVVDAKRGVRVGETWYTVREHGGKVSVWIDWMWIVPENRRMGYGTAALHRIAETALTLGAESIGLSVWFDNPGALALYASVGFQQLGSWMRKELAPSGTR